VKLSSSGAIEWQKALGGTLYDCAKSIQPTLDGGFIVAGETKSNDGNINGTNHGNQDAWVVKLGSNGNLEWQKTLGGSNDETSQSLQLTADGGYILAGYAASYNGDVSGNHGHQDIWIVKLSNSGAMQWQKAMGGANNENAQCIQPSADGGYIVSGRTFSNDGQVSGNHGDSDAWVIKLKK
jgi:hypothetical protein